MEKISYISVQKEYWNHYVSRLKLIQQEQIIQNNKIIGKRIYYNDNGIPIEVDYYFKLKNIPIIRTYHHEYIPSKGLIKVSDLFHHENIINDSITVTDYTLEGTDGIGKTTTIEKLIQEGIVCYDRNLNVICKYMLFSIPMEKRIQVYKEYLENTKEKILFLVNMDEKEIKARISARNIINEFDQYAVEYNQMYYDTYQQMKEKGYLNNHLYLLDCTGLSMEEQTKKIKSKILR